MATIISFGAALRHATASQSQHTSCDRLAAIRQAFVNGLQNKDGTPIPLPEKLKAFEQMLAFPLFQAVFGDLRGEYARIPFSGVSSRKAKLYPFRLNYTLLS